MEKGDPRSKFWILVKRILARPAIFLCCVLGAAFVGGMVWNGTCRLFGWSYHLGGPGNWPEGWAAFAWGFFTVFPILPFALWAYYAYGRLTGEAIWRWKWVVLVYALAGGTSGVVFYNSGIREFITSFGLGEVQRELVIVIVWSSIISVFESLAAMACFYLLPRPRDAVYAFFQAGFSVPLSTLAVIMFYVFVPPNAAMLRGFAAGFALRVGLLCGLVVFSSRFLRHSKQVFLSYAKGKENGKVTNAPRAQGKDIDAVVKELYHRLKMEDGFQVWLDTEDIPPGGLWKETIDSAMRDSAVILICLSRLTRAGGFQMTEIHEALEIYRVQPKGSVQIMPLRLDDSDVPEELRKFQWVDLRKPDAYHLLRDTLRALVGRSD